MKDKMLIERFLKQNPLLEISAARIQYSLLINPNLENDLGKALHEKGMETDDMRRDREQIQNETDPEELLRWMRRDMGGTNKVLLCRKLLEMEDVVMPSIQRRVLTSFVDVFVENALHFLVRAKTDCSQWLFSHFDEIRNPYAQSMVCLTLGFRAGFDIAPWLMKQYDSLKARFPSETFCEGPLLALYELLNRYVTA
jgi:hypothetical protein